MKIKYSPIIDVEAQMEADEFVGGLVEKSNDGRYYFELEHDDNIETIQFEVRKNGVNGYNIVWKCPKCLMRVIHFGVRNPKLQRDDLLHLSHKIIEHRSKYCLADKFGNMEKIRKEFFSHLHDSESPEPAAVAIFYLANALMTLLDKGE
jgi:hypothetical protein